MSKPQRRKGNARCASSSKAAELLQNNELLSSLMSLEGIQLPPLNNLEPTSTTSTLVSEEFNSVSPEMRIIMKKFTKRDSMTREKSLKELSERIDCVELTELKAVFTCFAPIYSRLVVDNVPSIRCLATTLFESFLKRLRKESEGPALKMAIPFLLFSLGDSHGSVSRAAEHVLDEYFAGNKRKILMETFAKPTITLALEIISRKHKLIQPQQMVSGETDQQRQNRLIAQGIIVLERLLDENVDELSQRLVDYFTQQSTVSALMKMSTNIKSALFALLSRLIQINPEPFLESRIFTIILSNLDNENLALCRNAFECLLLLSVHERFRDACQFEKSVLPKTLSLIRKKDGHWKVLESSLFPLFMVICKAKNVSLENTIRTVIDSFFEGDLSSLLSSHLMSSWVVAFIEVVSYCLKAHSQISSYLYEQIIFFIDQVLNNTADEAILLRLVDFIVTATSTNNDDECGLKEFKNKFYSNVLSRLPKSTKFLRLLLEKYDDEEFCLRLVQFSSAVDEVFLMALRKHPTTIALKTPNLPSMVANKINDSLNRSENWDSTVTLHTEMLSTLCQLVSDGKMSDDFLKCFTVEAFTREFLDRPEVCYLFSRICPPTLFEVVFPDDSKRLAITLTLLRGLLSGLARLLTGDLDHTIAWILAEIVHVGASAVRSVLEMVVTRPLKEISVRVYADLYDLEKIPIDMESRIAFQLFNGLILKQFESLNHDSIVLMLNRLQHVDPSLLAKELCGFLSQHSLDETVKRIAELLHPLRFADVFVPSKLDIHLTAGDLECGFFEDMLMDNDCYLYSLFSDSPSFICVERLTVSAQQLLSQLSALARRSVFVAELIKLNGGRDVHALGNAKAFIALVAAFLELFARNAASSADRHAFDDCAAELANIEVDESDLIHLLQVFFSDEDGTTATASTTVDNTGPSVPCSIPLSVIYTLRRKVLDQSSSNCDEFTRLREVVGAVCARHFPSLAFAFALNLHATAERIPLLAEPLECLEVCDQSSVTIRRWVYEFERATAVFCAANRAAHFVTLSIFVERHAESFNEWLFTAENCEDPLRGALSFALLRFCAKVVIYLSEVNGPIRDFLNCGFVTALQSCTDGFFAGENGSVRPLLHVMARHCFRLFFAYDNCMQNNAKNVDYYDIRQEWEEFFAPSAINFMFSWFLGLLKESTSTSNGFVTELCRAIHFVDGRRLEAAECLLSLDEFLDAEITSDYFGGYTAKLRCILAATVQLLYAERPQIQLAAGRILNSFMLTMFLRENKSAKVNVSTADDDNVEKEDEELSEEDSEMRMPKFVESVLTQKFVLNENRPRPVNYFRESSEAEDLPSNADEQPSDSVEPILIVWDSLIRFFAEMDAQTRVQFCDALSVKLVDHALGILFSKLVKVEKFNAGRFVCNLYYRSLITIPAIVRQWYLSLPRSLSSVVNLFTRKHVSPLVLRHEMTGVGASMKRGRLEIQVMPKVNEVTASYRMDDTSIGVNVALPDDFPLAAARIDARGKLTKQDVHRKWLLQLNTFLSHQNGPLLDGILQWKRNIDQHLDGVDDCTICMLTVSSTNYQLPRIRCRQCKNKFHGDCLYKWFKTSANTSCPLCRTNFVGIKTGGH